MTIRLPAVIRRLRRLRPSRWGILLTVLLFASCGDRTYLTKSHGRANKEAFERQAANPAPRPKKMREGEATEGLDSQEAAVIARSYHHSLSGKEATADNANQSMVITNAPANQGGTYMPPPSVPNGQ